MKDYHRNVWVIFLVLGFLAIGLWGCATLAPTPKAELQVIPDKTVLSPELIKKPIQFKGSGFSPKEMVVVEMVLPPGVKVKGVTEEEDVGLAFANADENGNFKATMAASATLNSLFQVGWTPNLKPVFKEATPLPPGKYEIRASGMESDVLGTATLELLPPPKKKE